MVDQKHGSSNMKDCQITCKKRYHECSSTHQCFGIKCFNFNSRILHSSSLQRTKPCSCYNSFTSMKLLLAEGLCRVSESEHHYICWNSFSFTEAVNLTDEVLEREWGRTVPREACLWKGTVSQ